MEWSWAVCVGAPLHAALCLCYSQHNTTKPLSSTCLLSPASSMSEAGYLQQQQELQLSSRSRIAMCGAAVLAVLSETLQEGMLSAPIQSASALGAWNVPCSLCLASQVHMPPAKLSVLQAGCVGMCYPRVCGHCAQCSAARAARHEATVNIRIYLSGALFVTRMQGEGVYLLHLLCIHPGSLLCAFFTVYFLRYHVLHAC